MPSLDTLADFDGANIFDIRDVIDRFENLESERENSATGETDAEDSALLAEFDESEDGKEYATLKGFLESIEGYGGDHQWRGSWYPCAFIRDSYFTEYAQEFAEEIGACKPMEWPYNCIDWEKPLANCEWIIHPSVSARPSTGTGRRQ